MLKNYIVVTLLSSKNSLICIYAPSFKAFPVSASNYCSLKLRCLPNQLGVNQAVAPVTITVQVWPFTPPPNAPRSRLGTQEEKEGAKSTTQKNQCEPARKLENICSAGQRLSPSSVHVHGYSQRHRGRAKRTCLLLLFATKVQTRFQRINCVTLVFGSFCLNPLLC